MSVQSLYKVALGSVSLGVFALALAGCGSNVSGVAPSKELAGFGGSAFGGPSPVVGATVTLYATGTTGYGSAGTPLGTTTTNSSGAFNYTSLAACPAGTQAYITATGGNPGSGTNPNYLLMAAMGPCSSISTTTFVKITEATTVAAAYALRPFTTVAAGPAVNIGAPANNNAATGVCTTVAGATTGCTAAGLAHAMANANNLVNAVGTTTGLPSGQFYQVTPSNANGVVPTAMLNSLANAVEACVNSAGGTAGDSSPCGNLFTYTTPPPTGSAAPTNTLQAMLDVAQYPALTPGNVANLYNMSPATSFYMPALSSQPTDFSLAIAYPGPTVSGVLSSITPTLNNASGFGSGTGYTSVPLVTLSGGTPTTAATATAVLGLTYFSITSAYTGVCPDQAGTTTPISIPNGTSGGSGAAATVTYDATGKPISEAVTASGSGYTTVPTITIACTAVNGGTATQPTGPQKIKGFGVVSFTITNPGAGYQSAPTVTVGAGAGGSGSPTPVQAAGTANIAAQSTPAPYSLSLDANDNVYVGWQNATGTAGANSFITGNTANGTTLFMSTPSTSVTAPRGSMTDTLGHLWVAENNTTGTGAVTGFNTADGSLFYTVASTTAAPYAIGVDLANNVWYGEPTTSPQNLFELQQAATTPYTSVIFTNPPLFTSAIRTIQFGANQNVFVNLFSSTANSVGGFGNTGTRTAPSYGTTAGIFTGALTGGTGSGIALDAMSNVWAPTNTGLFEAVPTLTGTMATGFNPINGPLNDGTTVSIYDAVDGAGMIWLGTNATTGAGQTINQYTPGTGAFAAFAPCYAPAGGTTCAATNLNDPQRVQVDSTGAVWITSVINGRVYQMIGPGAPTWPQLSYSNPGVMPQ